MVDPNNIDHKHQLHNSAAKDHDCTKPNIPGCYY